MVTRNLTDVFILMRNNSIQARQIYNFDQNEDIVSDRVSLISHKTHRLQDKRFLNGKDYSKLSSNNDIELGNYENDSDDDDEENEQNEVGYSPYGNNKNKVKVKNSNLRLNLRGDHSYNSPAVQEPPIWIDDLLDFKYNINLIKNKIAILDKFQNENLQRPKINYETKSNSKQNDIEENIEALTNEITKLFNKSYRLIEEIKRKGINPQSQNSNGEFGDKRLRDNVVKSMVKSLQDPSHKFRSSQGNYLKKITAREELSKQLFENILPNDDDEFGQDFFDFDDPSGSGGGGGKKNYFNYDQIFLEPYNRIMDPNSEVVDGMSQEDKMELLQRDETTMNYLRQREMKVETIVKSINDLNGIFRELATMVTDQSNIIDRIDYNIENTQYSVQEGTKQLQKAHQYQTKKNKKLAFFALLVIITILFIVFVLSIGS